MTRVLVVDDDDQVRRMLCRLLRHHGYEVAEAPEGSAAIRQYRERPADVVLMDLIMPGKEGLETIRELRAEFPDVRIIAMSGGGRTSPQTYLGLAVKFGARRALPKPVENDVICRTVEEVLAC